ncbi:MAG: hypothetical protein JHC70_03375 [Rhodococcus sp.]|uniref:Uncharacterized protein n=1 Tax=Mycolicibacterium frederiksbergense TaxID=117567 RepID=A0A6H0RYI9_9MYCO|nr:MULTISPECIES: hypothetical protein [Mycobacteriales]MBJ7321366.1 hypothetical protein [Rhodococcus sp. (in: high G+C Gram-positive bacteria)]MBY6388881.1 hypothetical protein [Rhodococcus erythropolis]QIV79551.1 hypothetical protein EXE63_00430 [Mycolicibacterium frederiksbergense]
MTVNTITAQARFVGSAVGVVRDGECVVEWQGEANLYHLDPPLRGFTVVVASTLASAPRVAAAGGIERGVETFLLGVVGEDLQLDSDELPGSGWGNTLADAFAEAGYTLV